MRRISAPLIALLLALAAALLAPQTASAQASGAVEVSVQIVPAPTFLAESPTQPSSDRPAARSLSTMRMIGAANCRLDADVAGERVSLGACGEQSLLTEASQRTLSRRAAGRPVLVTVTVDAGT